MKREQTIIRLPSDLKEEVQRQADMMGVSFNEMAIKLLHEGIKNYPMST